MERSGKRGESKESEIIPRKRSISYQFHHLNRSTSLDSGKILEAITSAPIRLPTQLVNPSSPVPIAAELHSTAQQDLSSTPRPVEVDQRAQYTHEYKPRSCQDSSRGSQSPLCNPSPLHPSLSPLDRSTEPCYLSFDDCLVPLYPPISR